MLSIVLLDKNHGVLSLCHVKVVVCTVHTQGIGLHASAALAPWQGIGMDRHKQVCLVLVGDRCPPVQRHKHIGFASIYHLYVRTVALYQFSESERHIEVDILLQGKGALGSRIGSAMTGINDKGIALGSSHRSAPKQECHP